MIIMKLQITLIKRLKLKKMQTFAKRQETKMTQDKTYLELRQQTNNLNIKKLAFILNNSGFDVKIK